MSRAPSPVSLTLLAPGWPVMPGDADPDAEPGAGEPADDDGLRAVVELPRIAWRRGPVEPIEAALLRELGFALAPGTPVPSANAWWDDLEGDARLAVERAVASGERVLRADPVHLSPDRDTALLLAPEALVLEPDETLALVAALDAFLATDGMRLHSASAERWYLTGPGLPDTGAPPSQAVSGRRVADLADTAPAGPGAPDEDPRALRALASELEMLLHAHPVSAARRARGRPAVTGLWFHGPAGPWPALEPGRSPIAALVTDDVFARAAAMAAGVRCIAPGTNPSGTEGPGANGPVVVFDRSVERASLMGDAEAATESLQRLVREYFGAFEVSVHAGDGRVGRPEPTREPSWLGRAFEAVGRRFGRTGR